MTQEIRPTGMLAFTIVWTGQAVSFLGSAMSWFAFTIWAWQTTGEATALALVEFFAFGPTLLLSPLAGALVDRWSRKLVMMLSDLVTGLGTIVVLLLYVTNHLQIWHIYTITFFESVFGCFQSPAYSASITMMVPKKDLSRASGIQQMGYAVESLLIPLIAGVLYAAIGLRGVILIDFVTYFFAIGALLFVRIPQPTAKTEGASEKSSMWADALFGWRYLRKRPGLFGLLWYYAIVNFFLSLSGVLVGPMILSFGSEVELGIAQMAGGAAMLIGGLLMGVWGEPIKRKIWGVIGAIALSGIGYALMGLRPSIAIVAIGQFIFLFFIPVSAALSQAVWQVKVPADIQGRVFSIRSMIAWSIIPTANLVAGPLADHVFEPMMQEGGVLYKSFVAVLIGTGPGRGIGLIFIASACFLILTSAVVFTYPRVRNLEVEIPDAIGEDEDG